MSTSQMNVRIDDDIRIEGNAAFESVGWSPSQAARALWGYAARNRQRPRKLREMMNSLEESGGGRKKKSQPSEAVLRGPLLIQEFREKHGLKPPKPEEMSSYEELREEAFYERYRERGLL